MIANSDLEIYTPVTLTSPTTVSVGSEGTNIYGVTVKPMTSGINYKNAIITSGIIYRYGGTPGDKIYSANGTLAVSPVPGSTKIGFVLPSGDLLVDIHTGTYGTSGVPTYLKSYMDTESPIVISAVPKSVTMLVDQITWVIEDDYTETIEDDVVTSIVPLRPVEGMVIIRYLSI